MEWKAENPRVGSSILSLGTIKPRVLAKSVKPFIFASLENTPHIPLT